MATDSHPITTSSAQAKTERVRLYSTISRFSSRPWFASLLIWLFAWFVLGGLLTGNPTRGAGRMEVPSLTCRDLEVVGDDGKPRIRLATTNSGAIFSILNSDGRLLMDAISNKDGRISLTLRDGKGTDKLVLSSSDEGGSAVRLYDNHGTPRASLSLVRDDYPNLCLYNQRGEQKIVLSTMNNNYCTMRFIGVGNRDRVKLAMDGTKSDYPSIGLCDKEGIPVLSAVLLEDSPRINLLHQGKVRSTLSLADDGRPAISIRDNHEELLSILSVDDRGRPISSSK
ncbi:hypothetical protein [Aquisphaera insulae]|uniref:hypothetical protein n=1 Tax=Aquisphaera insulae TaxID=2712864 RepID=UPI0013EC5D60|nr:hypothetical protein [Aquisphaera insulae]